MGLPCNSHSKEMLQAKIKGQNIGHTIILINCNSHTKTNASSKNRRPKQRSYNNIQYNLIVNLIPKLMLQAK